MLGRALPPARLEKVADAFAADVVADSTFADARDRIAADRAEGYRPVLATASYGFYARAIAARLGFDQVVATGSQSDGQRQCPFAYRRRELLRRRKAPHDLRLDGEIGDRARRCVYPLLFGPCIGRAGARMVGRAVRGQCPWAAAARSPPSAAGRSSTGSISALPPSRNAAYEIQRS